MKVRALYPLAAAVGIWVGGSGLAKEPVRTAPKSAPMATQDMNQKLAEAVAERLAMSGKVEGAGEVTFTAENGTITVSGPCRDAQQKMAILNEVRVVPGVKLVRDGLTVGSPIRQMQATSFGNGPFAGGQVPAVPPQGHGPAVEPAPLGAPGAGPADGFAPPLPPYAWPTYAPHNNASRIAYPQAYPYNAFPFIGPFYPFPKVPLGWRSVSLTWEDGHWWYGRTSAAHDYWRVRFW